MKFFFYIKKISAFTLLELSVVMVITGLVFAIAFSAYIIINKQYAEFSNSNEKIVDVSTVYAVLINDFAEAREIRKSGKKVVLTRADNSQIFYLFESNALIREINNLEDRFENISNEKFSFLGLEQNETNGLVDELYCEIEKDAFPLHIRKYYAADVLMTLEKIEW